MHRISRRGVQDFCRSVLGVPISLGAIQRLIDRTSLAIVPHDAAIARLARKARVGYVDETPWYCRHALQWLWSMVTDTVALYRIHPKRSQEAFGVFDKGLARHPGQRRLRGVSSLGQCSSDLLGASDSPRPAVVAATAGRPCCLRPGGLEGTPAIVSDGPCAAKRWSVASLVCPVVPSGAAL